MIHTAKIRPSTDRAHSARRIAAVSLLLFFTSSSMTAGCGQGNPSSAEVEASADAVAETLLESRDATQEQTTPCTRDAACSASPSCLEGGCATTKPLGSSCTVADECGSGHCVDGVCCGTATCPPCRACGADGTCGPAPAATPCSTPHATASQCDGFGVCVESQCASSYLDCDGDGANGCETPSGIDNCGTCRHACRPANAIKALCTLAATCTYLQCAPYGTRGAHYLDCDGDRENGCESDPSSASTCGSCGNHCGAAFSCEEANPGVFSCRHR
jgi:hypothetical protein